MGLLNALSVLSSATSTPEPNPYYGAQLLTPDDHPSIKQPTWVDANGNPITDTAHIATLSANPQLTSQPFNTPSFWSKLGSVGQEEQQANLRASQLQGSQLQGALAERNAAKNVYNLSNSDYANWGNRPVDQVTRNTQAQALQFANAGGPLIAGNAQFNADSAASQEAANRLKNAAVSGLLDNPQQSALNENQGLTYQSGEYTGNTTLQPQKFYNQGMGLGNESLQLQGQRNALPLENQDLYNRSLINATTSGQGVTDLPYTTRQMGNEAVSGLIVSQYAPLQNIVGNRINPDMTVTPRSIDPYGGNAQLLGAQHMMDGAMQQPTVLSSGNAYIRPPSSINPLNDYQSDNKGNLYRNGVPTPEVPTKTEEQQNEEDAKKAQLDHSLAIHNTAIAQHKEEQARLKAQNKLIGHTRAGVNIYQAPNTYIKNSRTGQLIGTPGEVFTQ